MGKLYACVDGLFLSFGSGELYKRRKSIARGALLFKEKTKTEDVDDDDDEADDEGWKTDE